jgi:hypothetical protein
MTALRKGDQAVETAAEKLERFVRRAQSHGGAQAKVGDAFVDDPDFLRKLKPSLIAARARGKAATGEELTAGRPDSPPRAPSGPQVPRPRRPDARSGVVSPWVVIGVALVAGYALAKVVDWRAHAHPRD